MCFVQQMTFTGSEMSGSQTETKGNKTSHSSDDTMLREKLKEVGVKSLSPKHR